MNTALAASRRYLTRRHFATALIIAAVLHFSGLLAWIISPKEQVADIPIRVLNLKLGDGEDLSVATPTPPNTPNVEQTLARHFEPPAAPPSQAQAAPAPRVPDPIALASKVAPPAPQAPQQAVRQQAFDYRPVTAPTQPAATQAQPGGTALGNNPNANAEAIQRYEQLVSTWLDKFKFYPDEMRRQGLKGVVVIVVQFDRRGNVRGPGIIYATSGSQVLDRTAMDMVNRANPFPPPPDIYMPGQPIISLKFPITFSLPTVSVEPQQPKPKAP